MGECLNCRSEFEAKRATAKYCSAKCRKLAFQEYESKCKDYKNAKKVSVPDVSVPVGALDPSAEGRIFVYERATGTDYEGRRKDFELLKSWHNGKGTPRQQMLGLLARKYSVINGYLDKHYKLTVQGKRYLGLEPKGIQ